MKKNIELYIKKKILAGLIMALLATKFGAQSTMTTRTDDYCIKVLAQEDDTDKIKYYVAGIVDTWYEKGG